MPSRWKDGSTGPFMSYLYLTTTKKWTKEKGFLKNSKSVQEKKERKKELWKRRSWRVLLTPSTFPPTCRQLAVYRRMATIFFLRGVERKLHIFIGDAGRRKEFWAISLGTNATCNLFNDFFISYLHVVVLFLLLCLVSVIRNSHD